MSTTTRGQFATTQGQADVDAELAELRDGVGMKPKEIGKVFDTWNKGRLNSYLIEITGKVRARSAETINAKLATGSIETTSNTGNDTPTHANCHHR